MLLTIFILCLSHLVLAGTVQPEYDVEDIEQLKYHFNSFKVKYNKTYTAEEEELRLSHFKANLVEIIESRKRNPYAEFGINKFADWSPQENENFFGFNGNKIGSELGKCTREPVPVTPVPKDLDYRDKNVVTPAQDQGMCRGWAFGATGVVESAHALKHDELLDLSEQQLIDCDQESDGCERGWMHYAFSTLIEQGGQQLEEDYPYDETTNVCAFDKSKVAARVSSCQVYEKLGYNDDDIKKVLVANGPVGIALDPNPFKFYTDGVITDCNYYYTSHSALLVGYGTEKGDLDYWLIKNSWSKSWGDSGFVKVQRGRHCLGIGDYVVAAQVE